MTNPVAIAHRDHWGRLLAVLVARYRRLDLAEDALAEAFSSAARVWPAAVPDNPAGWLMTAANRVAVDQLRREEVARRRRPLLIVDAAGRERAGWEREMIDDLDPAPLRDDQLRMIFLVAHPALAPEASAALALRLVLGLPTATIADLFLVPTATMAARLTRAKKRIIAAGIPLELPEGAALEVRITNVCRVVYLCFTAGYAPPTGDRLLEPALSGEAIRLGRLVVDLLPDRPAPAAGLAVMLLQHSRRNARVDADGGLVLLDEQDRGRWHHDEIAEGIALLDGVRGTLGGFGAQMYLQGRIAAEHAVAQRAEDVDWARIDRWYRQLERLTPSPVVRLNRAVAVSRAVGPAAGLEVLSGLDDALADNHRLHAVRADLYERVGDSAAAADQYRRALEVCDNAVERRHLQRMLDAVTGTGRDAR